MTAFIAAAAAVTAACLVLLLRPIVFAAPAVLSQGTELRRTLVAVAIAVPVVAGSLYALLGNASALAPAPAAQAAAPTDPQVEKMVTALAAKLEKDPSDLKGWAMLARSYKVMGKLREAEAAYDRAASVIAGDAQELANYADVAATNAGGQFSGKPLKIIETALRADPQNAMALWLAGAAAIQQGQAQRGVQIWQKLLALLPPESEDARELKAQIVQAGGTVADAAAPALRN